MEKGKSNRMCKGPQAWQYFSTLVEIKPSGAGVCWERGRGYANTCRGTIFRIENEVRHWFYTTVTMFEQLLCIMPGALHLFLLSFSAWSGHPIVLLCGCYTEPKPFEISWKIRVPWTNKLKTQKKCKKQFVIVFISMFSKLIYSLNIFFFVQQWLIY